MEKDWTNIHWKLVQPVTVLALRGRETVSLIENRILCAAQLFMTGETALLKMPKIGETGIKNINAALEESGFRPLEKDSAFLAPPEAPDLFDALTPSDKMGPEYWNTVFETDGFLKFQKALDDYITQPQNAFHLQLAADPKGFYNLQLQALNQDPATPPEQPTIADIFNDPKMQEIIRAQAENPSNPDRPSTGILKDPDAAEIMRKAMAPKPPKKSL